MFSKKKKKFQLKPWQGYLIVCLTLGISASLWGSFWYVNGIYQKATEVEPAAAATRRWDGGGANNFWNNNVNWEGNVLPGVGDVAVFDGTLSNKNVTISANIHVSGITINSDYTGTITQLASIDLDASGYTQNGGTFMGSNIGFSISCQGDFTLNDGTFRSTRASDEAFNLSIAGDFFVADGADFQHNDGMVRFTSDNNINIGNDYIEFYKLLIQSNLGSTVTIDSSDTVVILNELWLYDGYLAINGRLEMTGVGSKIVNAGLGDFDGVSGNLIFNAPTTIISLPSGSQSCLNADITINSGSTVIFSTQVVLDAANDVLNNGKMEVFIGLVMDGTLTNNGEVEFRGFSTDSSIANYVESDTDSLVKFIFTDNSFDTDWLTNSYTNLLIGVDDYVLTNDLVVTGNFSLGANNFDVSVNNYSITIGGDWDNSGNLIARSGTVTFNNAASPTNIYGDTDFYNLTCTTPGKNLLFDAGTTQNVTGNFTMNGTAGSPITLRSTVDGVDWNLNVTGNSNISNIDVKDSNATLGNIIRAVNSIDSGNNPNWVFGIAANADASFPASNVKLAINNGNTCTSEPTLNIEIEAINAEDILISESKYFVDTSWQPFIAQESTIDEIPVMKISWPLQDGLHGTKTIYLQLRSPTQTVSNIFSDSIEYSLAADCPAVGGGEGAEAGLIGNVSELKSGDYIKGETLNEIYYVDDTQGAGLTRHSTLDLISFYTYGKSLGLVKKVADTALRLISFGQIRVHNPGVVLIRFESRPEIYVIKENPQDSYTPLLLEITDESIPKAALGQNWQDYIVELNVAFYERFQVDGVVTSASQIDASKMKTFKELQSMVTESK